MITESSTLVDVAYEVCTALDAAGVTAVLTGGSAATFYAPHAYQSDDLDFIITLRGDDGGGEVLKRLGFDDAGGFYRHPQSRYPIEFPRGPLAVGDDVIETWSTHHRDGHVLHVLTPTDCCRDRLAAFLFWNDFSGLNQALFVAKARADEIDLEAIRAWCERERATDKFIVFERRFRERL